MSDESDLARVRPIYRIIRRDTLKQHQAMERILQEMFVAFHRRNRRDPDPNGHYFVAISPDWLPGVYKLELKQTATDFRIILDLPHIRKIPENLVTTWTAQMKGSEML